MTFVEWLRVRNVARVLAIVLGVLILVALVLRISFNNEISMDNSFIARLSTHPGVTITDTVLPDGTNRKTIVDRSEHSVVTVDKLGYGGYHIVVREPDHGSKVEHIPPIVSMHVNESTDGKIRTTTIETNGTTPFIYYMAIADMMAFVIATLLAAPFARENDGHLEFALTKPVSRTSYALGVMGVDLAGIVICSFMTVLAVLICQAMFEIPHPDFSGVNSESIVMGFAFPFAFYAMLVAATASLSRGYGAILGFAWPVAILVVLFGVVIPWGDSLIGQSVHNIFWVISRIDPLSYISSVRPDHATGQFVADSDFAARLSMEILLFVVYSVLAVVQWRRVEA
jgi:hypothetical protein